VIALLDDEAPFFENMDNHRFNTFRNLIESLNGKITNLTSSKVDKHFIANRPRYAVDLGKPRVLALGLASA
jgi:hypothetical protein